MNKTIMNLIYDQVNEMDSLFWNIENLLIDSDIKQPDKDILRDRLNQVKSSIDYFYWSFNDYLANGDIKNEKLD